MKRVAGFLFVLILILPLSVGAESYLIPVGELVGLNLRDNTVTVAAFDDLHGKNARDGGLRIGDKIEAVNGSPIADAQQVRGILEKSTGNVELQILRGSKRTTICLEPENREGSRVLGVYLRQGISGIGTVTWYDPETGRFGALGHGVSTSKDCLMKITSGNIYPAEVLCAQRGRVGGPGLLKGKALSATPLGTVEQNTPQGIFGTSTHRWEGMALPVGTWEGLHTGKACIRSTVSGGEPRGYSVEILKIYPKDRTTGRNFLLKVTDPELIARTGGIVQGMSGSPIIQDGRLIGAVTHVLVNDPTMGYGIFIESMLNAAG